MSESLNVDSLFAVGFVHVGKWAPCETFLTYELDRATEAQAKPLLDVSNALYAFCRGEAVLYIGKTTQSLRKRLTGYCKPGKSQATNIRCHAKIRKATSAENNCIIKNLQ